MWKRGGKEKVPSSPSDPNLPLRVHPCYTVGGVKNLKSVLCRNELWESLVYSDQSTWNDQSSGHALAEHVAMGPTPKDQEVGDHNKGRQCTLPRRFFTLITASAMDWHGHYFWMLIYYTSEYRTRTGTISGIT